MQFQTYARHRDAGINEGTGMFIFIGISRAIA
jgi:hypothetical protein